MMRRMIGRYKGAPARPDGAGVKRSVLARVGAVKPSLAPVHNENVERIGQPSHHAGKPGDGHGARTPVVPNRGRERSRAGRGRTGQGSGIMVYRGQIYRKVGDVRFWDEIEPHPGPGHQDEWFLRTLDSSVVWSVHELDLENQDLWVPVRDT